MRSYNAKPPFSTGEANGAAAKGDLLPWQRLELARQEVILPWAARLSQFDHLAEVYVTGGAIAARPAPVSPETNIECYYSGVNHGSDLDVIVISPRLLTPKHYIRFLEDLGASAAEFGARSGIQPVFFCHSASKHARVSLAKIVSGSHVVPIHFLFYPSFDAFYLREGALAGSLSKRASAIVRRDIPPTEEPDSWKFARRCKPGVKPEDMPSYDVDVSVYPRRGCLLRWDLECEVADFVLNYGSRLSQESSYSEFLKGEFAEGVRKIFRNFNLSFVAPEYGPGYDQPERMFFSCHSRRPSMGNPAALPIEEEQARLRRRVNFASAPPAYFGHSIESQARLVDLACSTVGRISHGDYSPDRAAIIEYGQLLLESCFVGVRHREAFISAALRSYSALPGVTIDKLGGAGLSGCNIDDRRFWLIADDLACHGELQELTHFPVKELPYRCSDRDPIFTSNQALVVPSEPLHAGGRCPKSIEDLLRSPDQVPFEQRQAKVRQIAGLLTEDVIRQGLLSVHSDVRARAIECWGIGEIAPELACHIIELAQVDDARVRGWALQALSQRAPASEDVARFVASQLKDVELSIGLVAIEAARKCKAHTSLLLTAAKEALRSVTIDYGEYGCKPQLLSFLLDCDPNFLVR